MSLHTFQAQAQLSIMGVLDTRSLHKPRPAPVVQQAPQTQQQSQQQIQAVPTYTPPPVYTAQPSLNNAPRTAFSAEEIGFHKDLGVITAKGNVEIIHDDRVLIADTVSYNQNKNVVTASGNVQVIDPEGNVTLTEYLEITSDLKTGIAKKLVLSLADRSVITAANAQRKEGRYTIAEDATYSPCEKCQDDPERPLAWKLTAKEIVHDGKQRRLEYSDVFFEVFDVPVLYFPYFTHPDPTRKRESGFLSPSFGSRGTLDGFITAPFFVNIDDSTDLTLDPTYYYNLQQAHLGAEYRQHLTTGEIRLGGSLTYADGGEGATSTEKEEFRGHIDSEGVFNVDQTWQWGFDINHATDETYIRRYGVDDRSDNSHLVSELYMEGFRHRNYMKTNLNIYQEQREINTSDLQDAKVEYQFQHLSNPSSTGAYTRLDGDFYTVNRKNDVRTSRLSADTSWVVPYTSDTGDLITLDANLITAAYYMSRFIPDNDSNKYSGAQVRAVPSLSMEWRKPLSRTQMNGQANEIFEPIVKVKVAPNVGQNHKIANEDSQDFEFDDTNLMKTNRFTGIDEIDGGQRIDFGFNWGIFGREGGYSQMFIGQSYRMRDDDTYDTNSGHKDNLSDIVGRVEVSPSNFLDVLYRYRLDKSNMSLNRSETGFTVGPKSTRFNLSHLFIEGSGDDSEYGTREEIYGKLDNKISKNWYSSIDGRYRLNDPEGGISYGGKLGYADECTELYLDVRRSFSEDRDIEPSDSITLRLELKNLGGVGIF
ncbi:LPS assembly protein LptD [Terasakiella sp. A23]|uniref:LPS-assembly protein LptD n=1 Tax=Terasakiella sp. FCG-A23 TaxID=3080561 RepID=UPI002952D1EA|nr:LPS assembly protein LptD [Terasakiella sp. A23]MDV7340301.1 LPS assembly protein LptD [Terasakiella sp. A23]